MFTICDPVLSDDEQVALTLQQVFGLTTEEIARAFLVSPTMMALRLLRASVKRLTAEAPSDRPLQTEELEARLDAVLKVIYLVFNEGYAATCGAALVRADLCSEAIRLARRLREEYPIAVPELGGASRADADSRRAARRSRR
jgi:RNA polymerase sigma-70 factor (ECF subfamily)